MKQRNAEALLAAVIVARSTSFLLSKLSMRSLDPFNLLGLRFTLAFLILLALFAKRLRGLDRKTLGGGVLLGTVFFGVMSAELFGLRGTEAATASFLENTAVAWVPLAKAAIDRRFPERRVLRSLPLLLAGVALLTLGTGGARLGGGAPLCLLAAALYTCAILLTDRLSRKHDPLLLGVFQVGTIGVLGLAASFVFETPRLPAGGAEWGMLLALAVVCSCFGFTLQPVAQRRVSAERTGMFCALNPLSAAVLGAVVLGERPGLPGLLGAGLILCGLLLQAVPAGALARALRRPAGPGARAGQR